MILASKKQNNLNFIVCLAFILGLITYYRRCGNNCSNNSAAYAAAHRSSHRRSSSHGGGCIRFDAKVFEYNKGYKLISEVKIGEKILTKNLTTLQFEYLEVKISECHIGNFTLWNSFGIKNDNEIVTSNHPIYHNNKWIAGNKTQAFIDFGLNVYEYGKKGTTKVNKICSLEFKSNENVPFIVFFNNKSYILSD